MKEQPEIMTAAQKELYEALTPFQKRLAPALLSGLQYIDAYRKARPNVKNTDNSAKVIVNRTSKNPKFKAYMDSMQESIVAEAIMDRTEALERLSALARGNFGTMVDFRTAELGADENGLAIEQSVWKIKDSVLQDEKQLATIAELTASAQGLKMKLHSPVTAIQQLASIQGWVKAPKVKLDHSSEDGSMTPKDAATIDVSKLSTNTILELLDAYDPASSASEQ